MGFDLVVANGIIVRFSYSMHPIVFQLCQGRAQRRINFRLQVLAIVPFRLYRCRLPWHVPPESCRAIYQQIVRISIETEDLSITYDHRLRRIGHPVRSAIHKPQIGRLVVGWVTTSEYLLLYVFIFAFFFAPEVICPSWTRLCKLWWVVEYTGSMNYGGEADFLLLPKSLPKEQMESSRFNELSGYF